MGKYHITIVEHSGFSDREYHFKSIQLHNDYATGEKNWEFTLEQAIGLQQGLKDAIAYHQGNYPHPIWNIE